MSSEHMLTHMRPPFKINAGDADFLDIPSAIFCGSRGLVLSEQGRFVNETADEHIYWLPSTMPSACMQEDDRFTPLMVKERLNSLSFLANELKVIANRNAKVVRLDDKFIYIDLTHPFGWYAFGHLHDSLQRLYSLHQFEEFLEKGRVKFLVCRFDRVRDFELHLSALLRREIDKEELIVVQQDCIYHVPRLIKPRMQSVYTNFTPDVYSWMIDGYKKKFDFSQPNGSLLYLTRNHVKPGFRGVLNEDALLVELKKMGFTILTGNEALPEIISKFSAASFIVGPHGSLFANTIFCNEDCQIVEFCPKNRPDFSFLRKTKMAKNYRHVLFQADDKFNIELKIEDVLDGSF